MECVGAYSLSACFPNFLFLCISLPGISSSILTWLTLHFETASTITSSRKLSFHPGLCCDSFPVYTLCPLALAQQSLLASPATSHLSVVSHNGLWFISGWEWGCIHFYVPNLWIHRSQQLVGTLNSFVELVTCWKIYSEK